MDALIAAVDVKIPVDVQEGDAEPLNQEFFYPVCAGLTAPRPVRCVVRDL